jgi:hypothetical protein
MAANTNKEDVMVNMVVKYKGVVGCALLVIGLIAGIVFIQAACAEREILRGTAGGALGGAAVAKLSDGDTGKGAAWGAGIGAAKGVANKRRNEQQMAASEENAAKDARIHELEMQQAYEKGQRDAAQSKNTDVSGK